MASSPLATSRELLSSGSVADTQSLLAHRHQSLGADTEEDSNSLSSTADADTYVAMSKWGKFKHHPVIQFLRSWWRTIVIILPPLLFLPLPILWETDASKAMYAILIMAVYWVTEVVPFAITALLPLLLFPALGVLSAGDTARNYLKDSSMLFVGSLMMAVAIEKWNLHKRIALLVLMVVGSKPKWLLFGFMGTTAFLSLWISNTATAAMMLPIAQAVLLEIKEESNLGPNAAILGERRVSENDIITSVRYTRKYDTISDAESNKKVSSSQDDIAILDEDQKDANEPHSAGSCQVSSHVTSVPNDVSYSLAEARFKRMAKSLMLGIAYSANIGGIGTLTGTAPNIVLAGLASDLGINFGLWFVFAIPPMLLALLCSWLYLSTIYCDDCFQKGKKLLFKRQKYYFNTQRAKAVIKDQYKKLGSIRYAEVLLLVMFLILILLWLFREPHFIPGWGDLFKHGDGKPYVSDATAALTIVFLLFLIPSEPCCCSWKNFLKAGSSPRLLDWNSIQRKLPWNVILFFGSGLAIAEAAEQSGLSVWIGHKLLTVQYLPREVIAIAISCLVAGTTEFISNIAAATLFLPVLRILGVSLCIHPLYLMIPATMSASFAFMVPVATPPNVIAFSYGYLKVYNMVLAGMFMNFICIGIVTFALNTVGVPIFGLNHFPTDVINGTNCGLQNRTDYF